MGPYTAVTTYADGEIKTRTSVATMAIGVVRTHGDTRISAPRSCCQDLTCGIANRSLATTNAA